MREVTLMKELRSTKNAKQPWQKRKQPLARNLNGRVAICCFDLAHHHHQRHRQKKIANSSRSWREWSKKQEKRKKGRDE